MSSQLSRASLTDFPQFYVFMTQTGCSPYEKQFEGVNLPSQHDLCNYLKRLVDGAKSVAGDHPGTYHGASAKHKVTHGELKSLVDDAEHKLGRAITATSEYGSLKAINKPSLVQILATGMTGCCASDAVHHFGKSLFAMQSRLKAASVDYPIEIDWDGKQAIREDLQADLDISAMLKNIYDLRQRGFCQAKDPYQLELIDNQDNNI